MPTFADGESLSTVRTKINDAITKVDGVEAGADVTDTANVTAAGALMTTGGSVTGTLTSDELTVSGDSITIATSKTPASATDTGTAGEVAWDANYIYVCTATNTWVRAALATW